MGIPFVTGQVLNAADLNALSVAAILASSTGASLIGYGSGTVKSALDAVTNPVTSVNGHGPGAVTLAAADIAGVAHINGDATQNFSVKDPTGTHHALSLGFADGRYQAIGGGGGGGSVTSVGLSLPADFTISGSPVTGSGVLTAIRANQAANSVLAAPSDGAGAPVYRLLVAADIPTLNQNTTGTAGGLSAVLGIALGGSGQTTAQAAINALTGVTAATNEFVLTKDTTSGFAIWKAASSGGSFVQPGTGAVTRTMQNKVRESVSALDYGMVGDNSTDNVTFAANFATALPGNRGFIPAGKYVMSGSAGIGTLHLVYHGGPFAYDDAQMASLLGAGPQNTILCPTTANAYAVQATGISTASVMEVEYKDFTVSGRHNSGGPNGLFLEVVEMMTLTNLRFEQLHLGVYANSVEYLTLNKCFFEVCTYGIQANLGAGGFTYLNGTLRDCLVNACSANGLLVTDSAANVNIEGGSFANCGTMGVSTSGAINMSFTGATGGNGLNIKGVYFEGNMGGADIILTNTSSTPIVHIIEGCNFNRVDGTNFVTHNIVSTGPNIIVLIGCTFRGYNSYAPNAAHSYVSIDSNTTVVPLGCSWNSTIEAQNLPSQNGKGRNFLSISIYGGAITSSNLPLGWTAVYLGVGVYQITHNLNSVHYIVLSQVLDPGYVASTYITGYTSTTFTIGVRNAVNAAVDASLLMMVEDAGVTGGF